MYFAQVTKNRIKYVCKLKKINANKMLLDCELGANAIQQINDTKGMASFSLAKIADYLGVSVDYLLGRTDVMTMQTSIEGDLYTMERERINCYRLLLGTEGLKYVKSQLSILIENYGFSKFARDLSVELFDVNNFLKNNYPYDSKVLAKLAIVFSTLKTNLKEMNFDLKNPDFLSNLNDIYTNYEPLKKEIDIIVGKTTDLKTIGYSSDNDEYLRLIADNEKSIPSIEGDETIII